MRHIWTLDETICWQPYEGELVPPWRFRMPEVARAGCRAIYLMFLAYLRPGDFVAADMARELLPMGFTQARRYANYRGGRKYDPAGRFPDAESLGRALRDCACAGD
jgi:hypothetical protein